MEKENTNNVLKNVAIQIGHGTCGIYNLANALQDDDILTYVNQDELIPCGIHEMNKILELEDYPFRVIPMISLHKWERKIPHNLAVETIEDAINSFPNDANINACIIFILVVQIGDRFDTLHSVTLAYNAGIYYYSDPRNDLFDQLNSIDELFDKFNYINQICTIGTYLGNLSLKFEMLFNNV